MASPLAPARRPQAAHTPHDLLRRAATALACRCTDAAQDR
jgi:hypothetical protein